MNEAFPYLYVAHCVKEKEKIRFCFALNHIILELNFCFAKSTLIIARFRDTEKNIEKFLKN